MRRVWPSIVGIALLSACSSAPDSRSSNVAHVSAALRPLDSCADVEQAIRGSMLREMNRQLDEALLSYLESGGGCDYGGDYLAGAGGGAAAPGTNQPSSEGASQVSGTNNQVAGVDEADFIKNDNAFIYVLGGGKLHIIDAFPQPESHELSATAIDGVPKKLFVEGNRALVYSSIVAAGAPDPSEYPGSYGSSECTYGYDCDFTGDGTPTRISVFDISDKTAPVLMRQVDLSGSFVSARRVGASVHTVIHDDGVSFPGVAYWPNGLPHCGDVNVAQAFAAFDDLRQRNTDIIMSTPLGEWMPSVTDTVWQNGTPVTHTGILGSCEGFYDSPRGDGNGFVTILSIGIDDDASLSTATIVSRPGATYASSDALYLSVRQHNDASGGWYPGMDGADSASTVHKFVLSENPPAAQYAASGVVKGSVLNQFAMDEHNRDLRIATTSGHVPDPNVHSTVTVLRQFGPELRAVGQVDQIAPGEDIRSVRFAGPRGFVVTFKKTDPLFVLDLQDPTRPTILAELKIPGYSTYMHMMDDTHLLTIGYDADDQGDFAWFAGVMLQIFDVTVPTAPSLLHKEVIGTRGSSSEALTNHLAFTYFAPKNLLALPMTICEGGSGGSYGTDMTFSGLMVYDVTVADGFHLRGRIAHPNGPDGTYDSSACSNWWTQASTEVKRSIISDDYVFSVSESLIKVDHLDALGTDLVSLPIGE